MPGHRQEQRQHQLGRQQGVQHDRAARVDVRDERASAEQEADVDQHLQDIEPQPPALERRRQTARRGARDVRFAVEDYGRCVHRARLNPAA